MRMLKRQITLFSVHCVFDLSRGHATLNPGLRRRRTTGEQDNCGLQQCCQEESNDSANQSCVHNQPPFASKIIRTLAWKCVASTMPVGVYASVKTLRLSCILMKLGGVETQELTSADY